ncbi:hypothetical protein PV726_39990 [Streptomyces europaeiscabiei]|uniref:hypothetical protein n=1 Tax=Streptomyces europaeiscabiei TaxID=146819 RepID=UPI0029BA8390|nr:hypothetical protein [Streptomyces europaeiscabiei]MDX3696381.1 hypothetical protein [Streptomyces europaeiscabiei]
MVFAISHYERRGQGAAAGGEGAGPAVQQVLDGVEGLVRGESVNTTARRPVVGGDAVYPMPVPTTVGGSSSRSVTSFTRMENYQHWKISAHD